MDAGQAISKEKGRLLTTLQKRYYDFNVRVQLIFRAIFGEKAGPSTSASLRSGSAQDDN